MEVNEAVAGEHCNVTNMEKGDGHPSNFYVFIVGNNGEWGKGRSKIGDIALCKSYESSGVPCEQICFMKDKHATKAKCERKLKKFLRATVAESIFVFYYGGHGIPSEFCTNEENWEHEDVIQLIDKNFRGERVILLLDCCCSGNVTRLLQPGRSLRRSYLCIMSSPAYVAAGPDWTMTRCWIRAMECNNGNLPIHRVVAFLSDEHLREKGDQLTVCIHGNKIDPGSSSLLPLSESPNGNRTLQWNHPCTSLPNDAKIDKSCQVGDSIYYRHSGGMPLPGVPYVMPVWLPATVQSQSTNNKLRLQVKDQSMNLEWEVETHLESLVSDFCMSKVWVVPDGFEKAQVKLATKFKYIDFSIPSSTPLELRWSDGAIYSAVTMDWREVDWEDYVAMKSWSTSGPKGAHVPVSWVGEDTYSVVPLSDIVSPNKLSTFGQRKSPKVSIRARNSKNASTRRRDALLLSLETCGKHLCNVQKELGTSKLICFWPFDSKGWYDAVAINDEAITLKDLASHASYTDVGPYCVVRFCEDGVRSTVPLKYVRRREFKQLWRLLCCHIDNSQ